MHSAKKILAIVVVCLAMAAAQTWAHQANDSWLSFICTNGTVAGQWDLSVSDLDTAIGLDDNDDGNVSEDELQAHNDAILAVVLPHLQVKTDGVLRKVQVTGHKLQSHLNGIYVAYLLNLDAPSTQKLSR